MDFTRISNVIDVSQTTQKHVTIVGAAPRLACSLARSGVEHFTLIDFDRVSALNIPRQDFHQEHVGSFKVDMVAGMIGQVNPDSHVQCLATDFTTMTDDEVDLHLGNTDLLVLGTDSFAAQARGNQVALRLGISALWVGLYLGGRAGELFFWHPGLSACFRCTMEKRFAAHAAAEAQGRSLDISSAGATIFDIDFLDAIAGQFGIGLLTRGANNRFGTLIDQLGERNLLQVKIDPTYTWNGRDIFREQLQIPQSCDAYFSYVTIARSDPARGEPPCPDCVQFLGRRPIEAPSAGAA